MSAFFGNYKIVDELGRGAMGVVYRAVHRSVPDREVAIKFLLADNPSPDDVERFRREAQAAARLAHPGIVPIHEFGFEQGRYYYVMDIVSGKTLEALIKEDVPSERLHAILIRAARVLQYAHDQGVIHRDLKPENILVDDSNQVRILDFGLARDLSRKTRLTETGDLLGSPFTMAPEQAAGDVRLMGARTDVYALGTIAYRIATGNYPFRGTSIDAILRGILTRPDRLPPDMFEAMPDSLAAVINKALARRPEDRYPSAGALADDLEAALEGEPVRARPLARSPWRGRLGIGALCLLLLALGWWVLGTSEFEPTGPTPVEQVEEHLAARKWSAARKELTQLPLDGPGLSLRYRCLRGLYASTQGDDRSAAMAWMKDLIPRIPEEHLEDLEAVARSAEDPGALAALATRRGETDRALWLQGRYSDLLDREGSPSFERADAAVRLGRWGLGMRLLDALGESTPRERLLRARLLSLRGEEVAARRELREVARKTSRIGDRALLLQARLLTWSGAPREGRRLWKERASLSRLRKRLGRLRLFIDEGKFDRDDLRTAQEELESLAWSGTIRDEMDRRQLLGLLKEIDGRPEEALQAYADALSLGPHPPSQRQRSACRLRLGRSTPSNAPPALEPDELEGPLSPALLSRLARKSSAPRAEFLRRAEEARFRLPTWPRLEGFRLEESGEAARLHARAAVCESPSSPAALRLALRRLNGQGHPVEVTALLKRLLSVAPHDARSRRQEALVHWNRNEGEKALEAFAAAHERGASDADFYRMWLEVLYQEEQLVDALVLVGRWARAHPHDPEPLSQKIGVLRALGRPTADVTAQRNRLRKRLQAADENFEKAERLRDRAINQLSLDFGQAGQTMVRLTEEAKVLFPDVPRVWWIRAQGLCWVERWEEANEAAVRGLCRASPQWFVYLREILRGWMAVSERPELEILLEEADGSTLESAYRVWLSGEVALFDKQEPERVRVERAERLDRAWLTVTREIDRQPQWVGLWLLRARLDWFRGRYEAAGRDLDRARTRSGGSYAYSPIIPRFRAATCLATGDRKGARRAMRDLYEMLARWYMTPAEIERMTIRPSDLAPMAPTWKEMAEEIRQH